MAVGIQTHRIASMSKNEDEKPFDPYQSQLIAEIDPRPTLPPKTIAQTTADIFDLCLFKDVPLIPQSRDFLAQETLSFIQKVKLGIERYPRRVMYANRMPVEEFRVSILGEENLRPDIPYDETREALDFALIVMGAIPEHAMRKFALFPDIEMPIQLGKKGMFRPPQSISETRSRVNELSVQTHKVINGDLFFPVDFVNFPGPTRAVTFFDVARGFTLTNPDEGRVNAQKNFPDVLAAQYVPGKS